MPPSEVDPKLSHSLSWWTKMMPFCSSEPMWQPVCVCVCVCVCQLNLRRWMCSRSERPATGAC